MMENESGSVIEITDSEFDAAIARYSNLVVDCWAPWCGDCRRMAPVLEELAKDNAGKVTFAKINVDSNQGIKARYEIMAIPTLLVFKEGKLVDRKIEPPPRKSQLQNEIDQSFA
jgi:thioredoxin 1